MYFIEKYVLKIQHKLRGSMIPSMHIRSTELILIQGKKNLVLVLIRPLPLMSKGGSIMYYGVLIMAMSVSKIIMVAIKSKGGDCWQYDAMCCP